VARRDATVSSVAALQHASDAWRVQNAAVPGIGTLGVVSGHVVAVALLVVPVVPVPFPLCVCGVCLFVLGRARAGRPRACTYVSEACTLIEPEARGENNQTEAGCV
jgi:hypothetical protein